MFFYISGFSVTFFNTEKKSFKQYFCDKFKRLIIPLIVVLFVFLIPRNYMDQSFSKMGRPDGENPQWNFFKYYADVIPIKVIYRIGYLWFLPALFIDSMIAFPLLKWSQRRYLGKPCTFKDDYILIIIVLALFLIWGTITTFIIPSNLRWAYSLPSDLILLSMFGIYFFLPHNLIKKRENGYKYSLLLRFIGPFGTILLCRFKEGTSTQPLYVFVSMINFDLMFMAQGLIDQVYYKE